MPPHRPYPPEFRRQMVELVRAGRNPEELAREFEPSAQAIRNWVRQADLDEGRRRDGLTTDVREEIRRLRGMTKGRRRVWVSHNLAETLHAPTPLTWDIIRSFMSGSGRRGHAVRS